ncbi:MAG: M20 family metallopeptidase, partial [Roseiflexaceae bacterium]
MPTTPEAQALTSYLESQRATYLEELRQLCAIECPTASKAGVDEAGAWVRRWVAARGWELRDWPDQTAGDGLVATLRGAGQPRIMLVAHLDTIYPVGIAAQRPVWTDGDKLLGPGSADNKSGLLSGLYAMAALEDLGMLPRCGAISMVCGGDEETDMRSSIALLRELAPHYDLALVLEAGRENGDIVGARKGGGSFVLETFGKAAHAGVEPEKGAHAILALAQHTIALQALNGLRPGMTVNVGVVQGGTVPNAVPDHARATIDARVVIPEDIEPLIAALRAEAARVVVPGVRAELSGGWGAPPMARTPQIDALARLADTCAQELGFSVHAAATGGVSYANSLASMGLPVLDGLGPIGGLDHSPDEYILRSSIVPRTALLALLMLRS